LWVLVSTILAIILNAKGSKAGYLVNNSAKVEYKLNGILLNVNSNTDTFLIDKVVDINIAWQDSSAIKVSANDKARVLTYLVANEGNSKDTITLNSIHDDNSTFKAQNIKIFVDSNDNGIFDKDIDTEVSNLDLNEDENKTLFIVADIPSDNVAPGSESKEELIVTSTSTASTDNDNKNKIDTVIRTKSDSATGVYSVWDYWLENKKSETIHSEDNATHTGSKITYKIRRAKESDYLQEFDKQRKVKLPTNDWISDEATRHFIFTPKETKVRSVWLKAVRRYTWNWSVCAHGKYMY